jgi:endonuclease/exonuclease/phosphatase family metal-dependent hydrolase
VDSYAGYYKYFYLKRHILDAEIALPGHDNFHVVNTHLEAFTTEDDPAKKYQIDQFHAHLTALNTEGATWVGGGDLNSLPAGSDIQNGFADECTVDSRFEGDDYEGEEDWLDALFADFNSLMPLEDYQADNSAWFSYTGDATVGWTRTLDYLFSNASWIEGEVMQSTEQGGYETLSLSDHAPVRGILEVAQ